MGSIKNLEFVEGSSVTAPTVAIVEIGTATGGTSLEAVNLAYLTSIGGGLKNNISAAIAPVVGDDNTLGYSVGSFWVDTILDRVYRAVDVSTGAAIWREGIFVDGAQTLTGLKTFSVVATFDASTTYKQIATPASPASGYNKIYPKIDGNFYKLDEFANEIRLGGAGQGGINYISDNSDFEIGVTGYATYADAANVVPVDGTGGSATTAFAQTVVVGEVLRGTASGELAKDAANRQGEGVSYDFTIDETDKYSVLRVSFDYKTSTNYADGDVRVYIYDKDNTNVIELTNRDLDATSTNGTYVGEFQATDADDYRLILHVSSTNASAYDVFIDNVQVGPREIARGPINLDWESYTPTGTWSTNTTYTGLWKRNGDNLDLDVKVSLTGAPTTANLTINLPSGLVIDTIKLAHSNNYKILGTGAVNDSSSIPLYCWSSYNTSTSIAIMTGDDAAGGIQIGNVSQANPFVFASGDYITIRAEGIPIVGWSSNTTISSDFGNRVILTTLTKSSPQSTTSGATTKVTFDGVGVDKTAMFDDANDRIVISESGEYDIFAMTSFAGNATGSRGANLYVNGSSVRYVQMAAFEAIERQVPLVYKNTFQKGDYIELYTYQNSGVGLNTNGANTVLEVNKIQSPQTLMGSETVACRAYRSGTQSITDANANKVELNAVDGDTHNAFDTATNYRYTLPIPGTYKISAQIRTNGVTSENVGVSIRKNGSAVAIHNQTLTADNAYLVSHLAVNATIGDYFELFVDSTADTSYSVIGNTTSTWFEIFKV